MESALRYYALSEVTYYVAVIGFDYLFCHPS
jgi:hypothetical protein